jgi:thymidylate synthase
MRLYSTLSEALSEIKRDLYKGPRIQSTRVQQRVGENLSGRELLGYTYAIEEGGIPETSQELVALGKTLGFRLFRKYPKEMINWLDDEIKIRIEGKLGVLNELNHPALQKTIEGNWTSYSYGERLHGAVDALCEALSSTDTRRAYWPIFRPEDSLRASAPTRIPCSLGYQVLIRNTIKGPELILFYLQRSADFDTFFLSDIWLANQFKNHIAELIGVSPGQFMHSIISLHSFEVEGTEIY